MKRTSEALKAKIASPHIEKMKRSFLAVRKAFARRLGKFFLSAKKKLFAVEFIPEFLKTGLVKIRAHFTTWQLKAIKSRPKADKKAYI